MDCWGNGYGSTASDDELACPPRPSRLHCSGKRRLERPDDMTATVAKLTTVAGLREANCRSVEDKLESIASRRAREFGQLAGNQRLVTGGPGLPGDYFVDSNIAAEYVEHDPRPHPNVVTAEPGSSLRIVGEPGSILSLCGAQLHSAVPNETHKARRSIYFWTVHIDDLVAQAGPEIDSRSIGTSGRNYLRADTGESLPTRSLPATTDTAEGGVLVIDPAVLNT
jgi:hypothetical protein